MACHEIAIAVKYFKLIYDDTMSCMYVFLLMCPLLNKIPTAKSYFLLAVVRTLIGLQGYTQFYTKLESSLTLAGILLVLKLTFRRTAK